MAGLGFAVHHLQSTAKHSPADFGPPPARLFPVATNWTQTEDPPLKAGHAFKHAQDVESDLAERDGEVAALRRRFVASRRD